MKKFLSLTFTFILLFCLNCYYVKADDNIDYISKANSIYKKMLIESGLLDTNDIPIASTFSTSTKSFNNSDFSTTYAFIEKDGELVDAYNYILNAVYNYETKELTNTKLLGFTLRAKYRKYSQWDNNLKPTYYRHGTLQIITSNTPIVSEIRNFKCIYISCGIQTNENGTTSGGYIQAKTEYSSNSISSGFSRYISSSNIGNPYILRDSHATGTGQVFSGLAYRFTYGGRTYGDYTILEKIAGDDTIPSEYDFGFNLND